MFKISDNTLGIWFVRGVRKDFLLHCEYKDNKCQAMYRFRYYKDDKAFDSDDTKNWYTLSSEYDRDKETSLENMRELSEKISEEFGNHYIEFLKGEKLPEDFLHEILKEDFTHLSIDTSDVV